MWKNIRKGAESFFGHVVYVAEEGNRIRFWYNSWSGPVSLKDLYPKLFASVLAQEARISNLVFTTPDRGGRNQKIWQGSTNEENSITFNMTLKYTELLQMNASKKKEKRKEPKTLELAIELKLSFFQAGDSHLGDMETKFSSQYYFKSYKNGVIVFKF